MVQRWPFASARRLERGRHHDAHPRQLPVDVGREYVSIHSQTGSITQNDYHPYVTRPLRFARVSVTFGEAARKKLDPPFGITSVRAVRPGIWVLSLLRRGTRNAIRTRAGALSLRAASGSPGRTHTARQSPSTGGPKDRGQPAQSGTTAGATLGSPTPTGGRAPRRNCRRPRR